MCNLKEGMKRYNEYNAWLKSKGLPKANKKNFFHGATYYEEINFN